MTATHRSVGDGRPTTFFFSCVGLRGHRPAPPPPAHGARSLSLSCAPLLQPVAISASAARPVLCPLNRRDSAPQAAGAMAANAANAANAVATTAASAAAAALADKYESALVNVTRSVLIHDAMERTAVEASGSEAYEVSNIIHDVFCQLTGRDALNGGQFAGRVDGASANDASRAVAIGERISADVMAPSLTYEDRLESVNTLYVAICRTEADNQRRVARPYALNRDPPLTASERVRRYRERQRQHRLALAAAAGDSSVAASNGAPALGAPALAAPGRVSMRSAGRATVGLHVPDHAAGSVLQASFGGGANGAAGVASSLPSKP